MIDISGVVEIELCTQGMQGKAGLFLPQATTLQTLCDMLGYCNNLTQYQFVTDIIIGSI